MSQETLEARVTALEQMVADLQRQLPVPPGRPWWRIPRPPMTPDVEEAFDAMQGYCQYIRRTGNDPPPGWKPGDPIPEPDDSDEAIG